jgi:hypothetical protein
MLCEIHLEHSWKILLCMCNIFWFSSMGNLGSVIQQTSDITVIPLAKLLGYRKMMGIEVLFR